MTIKECPKDFYKFLDEMGVEWRYHVRDNYGRFTKVFTEGDFWRIIFYSITFLTWAYLGILIQKTFLN